MDNMLTNLPHFLLGVGLLLLIIEVILGFTTILLLTLGVSLMAVSGLMYVQILDQQLLDAFIATAVLDAILTAALWRPMKNLQKDAPPKEVTSDWIGSRFDLDSDLAPGRPGVARFSGANWQVKSVQTLEKGVTVQVIKVEVGVLYVEKVV